MARPTASLAQHMADVRALHARARGVDLAVDEDVVHDLRVALRRCRSLAQGLAAVDLENAAAWKGLARQARGLFDGLGALRDAQVMLTHAVELVPHGHVHERLRAPIAGLVDDAAAAVVAFDVDAWDARAAVLPGLAARALRRRPLLLWLALTRYDEAHRRHLEAMRSRAPTALHDTRIGVKRLRYTLESLLPDLHEQVGKPLKKLQELLGDLHDLDVLNDVVVAVDGGAVAGVVAARADVLAAYDAVANDAWRAVRDALPRDAAVVSRCRRACVVAAAEAAGVDGKIARRAERAAILLARTERFALSPAERWAAVLAPAAKKARERAVDRLLGFDDDEKAAIRAAHRAPVVRAARALVA